MESATVINVTAKMVGEGRCVAAAVTQMNVQVRNVFNQCYQLQLLLELQLDVQLQQSSHFWTDLKYQTGSLVWEWFQYFH